MALDFARELLPPRRRDRAVVQSPVPLMAVVLAKGSGLEPRRCGRCATLKTHTRPFIYKSAGAT
jgi:hypothetical protein